MRKYNETVEYTEDWRLVPVKEFSNEFFYFEYQWQGLNEIKKYWDNHIVNENKFDKSI
ncbi:MAG: hypothetical protein JXN65_02165 [Clostridia bacterium]|nr:hypothetical protein [Clostridia bacterium]